MRKRFCDACDDMIGGNVFVKCCRSDYHTQGGQKLEHVGDLCMTCWNGLTKKVKK